MSRLSETTRSTIFLGAIAFILVLMSTAADRQPLPTPVDQPDEWGSFPHESGSAVWYIRKGAPSAVVEWNNASARQLGYKCEVFIPGMPTIKTKLSLAELNRILQRDLEP